MFIQHLLYFKSVTSTQKLILNFVTFMLQKQYSKHYFNGYVHFIRFQ